MFNPTFHGKEIVQLRFPELKKTQLNDHAREMTLSGSLAGARNGVRADCTEIWNAGTPEPRNPGTPERRNTKTRNTKLLKTKKKKK